MAKHVFVVDDEKVIADTLAVILRNSGYQATALYDAQSALEQAAICCPQLVISDVVMPGMNGVDMAIQFRKLYPECKVLLFSGQAATTDFLKAAGAQGHDFELLAKPLHPTDLLVKVATVSETDLTSGGQSLWDQSDPGFRPHLARSTEWHLSAIVSCEQASACQLRIVCLFRSCW